MKLVLSPSALAELQDAAAFYTLKANVELGLAFVAEFERAANLVLDNPELGVVFRGTRRRYILRRFPYSLIYQITAEEIRILQLRITGGDRVIGHNGSSL
ncbi:MAG TPA: type II toxin-antitoxin system RelE/ParE family toxin [Steroidobacteraceae bacterium]|nr:type II toxin-antitoxin system RelE/ParE family toxin [Steroidobacteraceae bacterium]